MTSAVFSSGILLFVKGQCSLFNAVTHSLSTSHRNHACLLPSLRVRLLISNPSSSTRARLVIEYCSACSTSSSSTDQHPQPLEHRLKSPQPSTITWLQPESSKVARVRACVSLFSLCVWKWRAVCRSGQQQTKSQGHADKTAYVKEQTASDRATDPSTIR